jgi:uncharacterized membrane protein YeaQ/YmgE (transglycosylase-associated protein family)
MGIIIWLIIGIAGALIANRLEQANETLDKVLNFVLGILGAFVGGFFTNLVMQLPPFGFSWASLIVSALGTLVFLAILAAIRR